MADIPQEFPKSGGCSCGNCGCGGQRAANNLLIRGIDIALRKRDSATHKVAEPTETVSQGTVVQRNTEAAYARFTAEQKRKMRQEPGNKAAHRIVFIRRAVQITTFRSSCFSSS